MATATTTATKPATVTITCDREKLLESFAVAASVAPKRSPNPVIECVMMSVGADGCKLIATDTENSVAVSVDGVECGTPCELLLPVARFGNILRETSDDTLTLTVTDSQIKVKGQRSEFKLSSIAPTDFPAIGIDDVHDYSHEIAASVLRESIRRTIFSADVNNTRYALGGASLEFAPAPEGSSDGLLYMVCTDGRRLAVNRAPCSVLRTVDIGSTIIPVRGLQLIQRAVAGLEDGDAVQILCTGSSVVVRGGGTTIIVRLLEGRFPRWRDICKLDRQDHHIPLVAGDFHAAVRQAAIVASDESHGVDFTVGDGLIQMAAATAEVGTSRVEMEADYGGAEITFILDYRFVGEFLKILDRDQQFTMRVLDTGSAVLFTIGTEYVYVVMPLAREG